MQILVEFDKQTIIDKDLTFILTVHFEIGEQSLIGYSEVQAIRNLYDKEETVLIGEKIENYKTDESNDLKKTDK